MGKRGPVPKPTALRVLQGNASKRPLNNREPRPQAGIPTQPHWLLPEAKREWGRVVPELDRLGLLTRVDRGALAAYCQSWARYVQAERVLQERGLTFVTPNGYIQQRPEVAMSHRYLQAVRAFAVEFGLTPSSRSRVQVPAGEEVDELAEFVRRRMANG